MGRKAFKEKILAEGGKHLGGIYLLTKGKEIWTMDGEFIAKVIQTGNPVADIIVAAITAWENGFYEPVEGNEIPTRVDRVPA